MSILSKNIKLRIFEIVIIVLLCVILLFLLVNRNKKICAYDEYIVNSANEFGLEIPLIFAIVNAESRFNANAVSRAGAIGLMQLSKTTFDYMCTTLNLSDFEGKIAEPEINIYVGCAYLDYLFSKFETEKEVLAAYNAGEGKVFDWLNNEEYSVDGKTLKCVPYKETSDYIKKVLIYKNFYKGKSKRYESCCTKSQ